jgi:lysyl-tRNA synthetase class II
MVASGLERVFEIGCACRAEKHEIPRHLNEYVMCSTSASVGMVAFYRACSLSIQVITRSSDIDGHKVYDVNPEGERILCDWAAKEHGVDLQVGCPPHGGFAIGLERLTQKVLGLANVKEACLFPRDRRRVRP